MRFPESLRLLFEYRKLLGIILIALGLCMLFELVPLVIIWRLFGLGLLWLGWRIFRR